VIQFEYMKYIYIAVGLFLSVGIVHAASFVSSPTCTLTVSPASVPLLGHTPLTLAWTSTGGDVATVHVDAFSQPNIYTNTNAALNGTVTVPATASLGLAATVTITKYSAPYSQAICKVAVPLTWTPPR
jgi:hypothetical protein